MGADKMAENTPNTPKFICPNCMSKLKSLGFLWKKASLGVRSPCYRPQKFEYLCPLVQSWLILSQIDSLYCAGPAESRKQRSICHILVKLEAKPDPWLKLLKALYNGFPPRFSEFLPALLWNGTQNESSSD